jgi:hypothetical protein
MAGDEDAARGKAEQLRAEDEPGAGAARAARVDDRDRGRRRRDAGEIVGELVHRADVAPAAERVRAALGHHVRPTARAADPFSLLGEQPVAIAPRGPRDPDQLGADQAIEEDVAGGRGWVRRIVAAQDEHALHAELGGGKSGGARVVGLLAAARDHVRGLMRDGLGHQVLELADLVAHQLRAGVVVALDPDPRA